MLSTFDQLYDLIYAIYIYMLLNVEHSEKDILIANQE